jgi:hypothetical protein
MNPIVNHLTIIHPFHSQMWIILENNLSYFLLFNYMNKHLGCHVHWSQNHFSIDIFSNGGVKHPICQPLEHTTKSYRDYYQGWVNLAINIKKMIWHTIVHVIIPCEIIMALQQQTKCVTPFAHTWWHVL